MLNISFLDCTKIELWDLIGQTMPNMEITCPSYFHILQCISFHQTIPDCIRYIFGVFCYNFESQTNTFLLHINALACVKAEI